MIAFVNLDEAKMKEIVLALLVDLGSKRGVDLSEVDKETMDEWQQDWIDIITLRTQPLVVTD